MTRRTVRRDLFIGLKRWNRLAETFGGNQRSPQTEIGFSEVSVELCRARVMTNRCREIVVVLGELAQNILGTGIPRIAFQLLLELLFRLRNNLGRGLWPGNQRAAQASMDAGQKGIDFEDLAVLRRRVVPFLLEFQRFCIELVYLI